MPQLLASLIPLVALVISLLTFVASQIANQHTVGRDALDSLERRVQELEAELRAAREREQALTRENLTLLQQLTRTKNLVVECPLGHCPLRSGREAV